MNIKLLVTYALPSFLLGAFIIYFLVPYRYIHKNFDYIFVNTAMCTIEKSSEISEIGKQIALTDLEEDEAIVIFPSGTRSPMKRISNNDYVLIIQLVASLTGSTDTITLDKKTGGFKREAKGAFGTKLNLNQEGHCQ